MRTRNILPILYCICFIVLIIGCYTGVQELFASETDRPNIVLIYTDDHDLDEIGCYDGVMPTPHMDRLAEEGMQFSRYYVCSAVCSPSRYNALSGACASRSFARTGRKYPAGGPVNIGWEPGIVGEPYSLPQVLQDAGYATGMVGKWHQGTVDRPHFFPADADPDDPDVLRLLAENYDNVERSVKGCGFDYVGAAYINNVDGARQDGSAWLPELLRRHNMEWVAAEAINFLESNSDAPFFLYMAPTLVHSPSAIRSLESDPRATPRGYIDIPDVMPSRESVMQRARASQAATPERSNLDKAAASIWLDDGVGAVLDKIDELGLTDNTLVVLASDNGNVAKFSCYDGGARLPMLARWPGVIQPGSTCGQLVSNLDFAPSFFEVAGAEPPAEMTLDGISILTAMRGDPSYRRDSLFLEITTERAVVTDENLKYIAVRYLPEIWDRVQSGERFSHWGKPIAESTHTFDADTRYPGYFDSDQLYDLSQDPDEQTNRYEASELSPKIKEMRKLLRDYSAELPHTFGEFTE
jgi:arylsulfatase A-like enzyme